MRYMDDSIGIWRCKEEELEEEIKKMEIRSQNLNSEKNKIRFLDGETIRKADNQAKTQDNVTRNTMQGSIKIQGVTQMKA